MEFLIVTGLSGSGKSGAVNVLEDIGYYCIDNIPPQLIPKFADICFHSQQSMNKVAIVTDIRGIISDAEGNALEELSEGLDYIKGSGFPVRVLYFDASDETLIKRYKETRRRHPLDEKAGGGLQRAISMEREILSVIREISDFYIDTTDMALPQLKNTIIELFLENPDDRMTIKVMSFGFKHGMCKDADLIFDVRCLPNPYYIPELRSHTGLESCVRDYVMSFEQAKELQKKLNDLIEFLIPLYRTEGKTSLEIAFGCTGGKHRSVTFAENMYGFLCEKGLKAKVIHRDIDIEKL
ncbi:MAG: RNase adapter RapZ [Huintestinicola sp.]